MSRNSENWMIPTLLGLFGDGSGGGGGGLPPVTGSGKALVSVNGEWKQQDGYAYKVAGEEPTVFDADYIPWDGAPLGTGLPKPSVAGLYMLTATVINTVVRYDWKSVVNNERVIVECEKHTYIDEHTWNMSASLQFSDITKAIEDGREVVVRYREDEFTGRTVELKLDSYGEDSVFFGQVLPSTIGAAAVMIEFPSEPPDVFEPATLTYVFAE